jgi:NADPH2:quinone reductase
MRALVCKEWGPIEDLSVEEVPDPEAGPGSVVIDVKAAGVNFPDALIVQGLYQYKPPLPFSPGSEVAGIVSEIGEGVTHLSIGDRVTAVTVWGGFAEKLLVEDARRCIPVPDGLDMATASAFVMAYSTSYHALVDRADQQPGEKLLVLGAAGGVGLAAVEIGKALGLEVTAAASTDEKLAICIEHGADHTINYVNENLKEAAKRISGGGFDIVYDPVGGDYTEQALRATGWKGRLLVVGFAAGEIPSIPLNLTLLKGCDIRGVFWGSFLEREPAANATNLEALMGMFAAGTIRPYISARYTLETTADAIRYLADRKASGKVIIEL